MNGRPDRHARHAFWLGMGGAMALLLWLLPLAGASADDLRLEAVNYSALPGNRVQFRLGLSAPPPLPTSFTTESPARLVLDFPNTRLALPQKNLPVGVGAAHSVSAVAAGNRARLVFNLNETVPYDLKVVDRDLVLTLESGRGQAATRQAVAKQTAPTLGAPRGANEIRDIEFRRGSAGEGRVLITLGSPDALVDVREEGQKVLLDIQGAKLPKRLHQRLDVTDFATPVQSVESSPADGRVRVTVLSSGEYEYMAYQADALYTLEFRPLTKEEKEQQLRDKLVYTGERLSLNFQDIQIRAVLQLLADFTGLNIVVADTVGGKITLRLKNVPWDQALDIILKTKGLSMRRKDNVIMVAPTKEIADAEALELAANQKIQELAPLKSEFIQINYAKAADLAALLKSQDNRLLSPRGQVTLDQRTNTLLVQDTAAQLEDIRRLITKLDVPVRQVLIESRIVIANDDFAKSLGVRFGVSGSRDLGGGNEVNIAGGRAGYIDGSYTVNKGTWLGDTAGNAFNSGLANDTNGTEDAEALIVNMPAAIDGNTSAGGAINFLVGKIGSYLLQLELSAMQIEGRGEIISSPRVITADQNKASIKQGTEIPYQEASASGATSVSFKEAVLQLDVTPQITPDDRINMKLKVTKDNPDWTRVVNGTPPIDTRALETSVLVDNGETIVLGGVYEQEKSFQKESVPLLGDLPVLGNLFKTNTDKNNNKELLIFVTPKILKETMSAR